MNQSDAYVLPEARRDNLVTREIPGELLVYDLESHKAFCLNQMAASIWKKCSGKRTVAELLSELQRDLHLTIDERAVWLGLDQLHKANLLKLPRRRPSQWPQISRRRLVRAGVIAGVVPLVTMIVAPTPQSAATSITRALCKARTQAVGCGGLTCSDSPGTCQPKGKTSCDCI